MSVKFRLISATLNMKETMGGIVWIDDVYFGPGNLGLKKPPSTKKALKKFEIVKVA